MEKEQGRGDKGSGNGNERIWGNKGERKKRKRKREGTRRENGKKGRGQRKKKGI